MAEPRTQRDIIRERLTNQRLTTAPFRQPAEVVAWMGAVQAQDYPAAAWALGLRMQEATEAAIDQALAEGSILRTHIMRPTWHFVTPADIRWLLALTAARVRAASASMYRQLELDDALFRRSHAVLTNALQGGKQLTRAELVAALQQAGIDATEQLRFTYIMFQAELDGIICSGPRRGKQFTYVLLDEVVPPTPPLDREAALAELTRRYFRSHGPATVADFVWWSGLTAADARTGLALVDGQFEQEEIDGQRYWFAPDTTPTPASAPTVHLLPNYDEYLVAYTDRSAAIGPIPPEKLDSRGNILFNHTVVLDGRVVGSWKRTLKKATVVLEPTLFTSLTEAETQTLTAAAARYGAFLGLPVSLVLPTET